MAEERAEPREAAQGEGGKKGQGRGRRRRRRPVPLSAVPGDLALTGAVEDIISQTFEPDFIRSANFMQFKFDAGSYALAGRERLLDRDVLKIEYYPKRLFRDDSNPKKPPCEERAATPSPAPRKSNSSETSS